MSGDGRKSVCRGSVTRWIRADDGGWVAVRLNPLDQPRTDIITQWREKDDLCVGRKPLAESTPLLAGSARSVVRNGVQCRMGSQQVVCSLCVPVAASIPSRGKPTILGSNCREADTITGLD